MWIWLGGILILLLLVIVLLLMSNISIDLLVRKKNWDETILLNITLVYGLVRFHYEVPSIVFRNVKEGFNVEDNVVSNFFKGQTSSNEQDINEEKIKHWTNKYREILKAIFEFKKWFNQTLKRISFHKLDWSTNVALSDAAHTATLTGALWGIKTTLVGGLSHRVSLLQRPKLFVVPVFGCPPLFSTEIHCIAKIRCGYAIYAGLILIVRVLKVKGGVRKWLNILFKD
ncbi:DUF2953 domain-containing protein [Paenibacillus segetis]|uniref:DUF2953 domain-containing protein n=1 Tax=Paenibacillus segetis TaxID=1325360 RepID=A0ABQ1YG88_9BACL|nr:DUF2953 domain-containing protein [Paenibacillus segetis]GGH24787.1 hypothetical protein GCM10008013_24730 [Paenibacillus segetis]